MAALGNMCRRSNRCDFSSRLGRLLLVCAGALILAASTASAQNSASTRYEKEVSSRLNTSGRAVSMPVTFRIDGIDAGEVVVRINPDDSVMVTKSTLAAKLAATLDKPALDRLSALGDASGGVAISELKNAGFDIQFDAGKLELQFAPSGTQRGEGDISLGRGTFPAISSNSVQPAKVSGFLNVFAGADHVWANDQRGDGQSAARLDFQSALRLGSFVIENDARYEGDLDLSLCPLGAKCVYSHSAGVKRERTTAVYDIPDEAIRIQAGDAFSWGTGLQRSPDFLGVSVEKAPRKLRPGENIRASGRSSFRLERAAEVEVVVNGAVVQRLRLRPGSYNLSDLPLTTGANEIQLIITDDTGDRRKLSFTTFFDGSLLGEGKSEWALSAGVPSFIRDNERRYLHGERFATGFYRLGLNDVVTGEVNLQGDSGIVMGGAGLFAATPWGNWGAQGALSSNQRGLGYAGNLTWDVTGFTGLAGSYFGGRESLRLSAEYRSSEFSTPGEYLTTAGGILYPQFNYRLRLTGYYSLPLSYGITATLGARYQFADDKRVALSPYTIQGDRYGADLTLSAPLASWASGSLTFGYSNESYLHYFARPGSESHTDLRMMARLNFRADDRTSISASYDSHDGKSQISGYRIGGRGLDRWESSAEVQRAGASETASAGGSVRYFANRAEVSVAHTAAAAGTRQDEATFGNASHRTSARVGSSIAFAGDTFGVGPPIRGSAFAIVHPHESIRDKEITVGQREDVRARANAWGNAVVTDVPAYTPSTIPVDVEDLPLGYSLGAGTFDTYAPYRAGYSLQVGSNYSVSAYGTLLNAEGQPVSLRSGTATAEGDPARQVAIFTNAGGRFGAEGLAPGRWNIEMASDNGPVRYVIDVPEGTNGLLKVGVLQPAGG